MSYKISVIIPIYNVEKYIGECLDSIVNQTLGIENIEVIAVNDCTPDNSMDIVKEYAKKYPSIKIVEHERNQGQGIARNTGLKHVNSDYITFIDSDDFISENTYEVTLNKFREHGCDLVIYKYKLFSKSGKEYPIDIHQEIYRKNALIEDIKDTPEIIFATSPCNKIYPKKLIPFLNFPAMHYEDNVVAAEILFNSKKICVTDECTYFYRRREGGTASTTKQFSKKSCLDLLQSNIQLHALLNKYPDYQKMIAWINLCFSQTYLNWMLNLNLNLSHKERAKIIKNTGIILKNISKEDIHEFNLYFPDYKLKKEQLILDAKNKNYLTFFMKYKCYLPLKKKYKKLGVTFKKTKNKILMAFLRILKIVDIVWIILFSFLYRIKNRSKSIWLFYANEKDNHVVSDILENINKNHPEINAFYIVKGNERNYPQIISSSNIIRHKSTKHKIYFILASKLITDKKGIIEPWNYSQFNKFFRWSGPDKNYMLLQDKIIENMTNFPGFND